MTSTYESELQKLYQNLHNAEQTYGPTSTPTQTIRALIADYIAAQRPPLPHASASLPSFKNLVLRPKKTAETPRVASVPTVSNTAAGSGNAATAASS